ncbi:hypothetical protein Tco_1127309 [Tanacetum coccineum]
MDLYHSRLTPDDLNDLIIEYKIPCDLHPQLPLEDFVMSELLDDAIGIYHWMFDLFGVRIPFSSLLLALIKHYRVHFSQLGPLGLNKTLCKQGDWFSFSKCHAPSPVCIDDNRSSMKHWKSGLFFIDRRAISDAMVWRHLNAAINDLRPVVGILDFLCLPEWNGAEVQEEPHLDVRPTLQRLPFYCTSLIEAEAVILDPTPEDLGVGTPGFHRCRCTRTELITPDLICPSTYQLLRNSGGDSGSNLSFDKSAFPERLFSLAFLTLIMKKIRRTPYKRPKPTPFTTRITRFKYHWRAKLLCYIKVYKGNKDPEDHLGIFSADAEQEKWPMLIWYAKDPTEIQGINRKLNEGLQAFMDRFKIESSHIKGVLTVLHILAFIHDHVHPELDKKLNYKIPKTVDEMSKRVRAFFRGEVAAGSAEVARALQWDKGNIRAIWFGGQERIIGRSSPREFRRSVRTCAPYSRRETFTPLTKTPKEILAMKSVNFVTPPPLIRTLEKQNLNEFCDYHADRGHNTNDCYHSKKQIEETVASGKLDHLKASGSEGSTWTGEACRRSCMITTLRASASILNRTTGVCHSKVSLLLQRHSGEDGDEKPWSNEAHRRNAKFMGRNAIASAHGANVKIEASEDPSKERRCILVDTSGEHGVPRLIMEHQLKAYPLAEPVIHKKRPLNSDQRMVLKQKVLEWLKARIIKRV